LFCLCLCLFLFKPSFSFCFVLFLAPPNSLPNNFVIPLPNSTKVHDVDYADMPVFENGANQQKQVKKRDREREIEKERERERERERR